MKHKADFQQFLSEEVNLNQTRLDKLVEHVAAVTGHLSNNLESYESVERQSSGENRHVEREFD